LSVAATASAATAIAAVAAIAAANRDSPLFDNFVLVRSFDRLIYKNILITPHLRHHPRVQRRHFPEPPTSRIMHNFGIRMLYFISYCTLETMSADFNTRLNLSWLIVTS
jgi:hypothetical protein